MINADTNKNNIKKLCFEKKNFCNILCKKCFELARHFMTLYCQELLKMQIGAGVRILKNALQLRQDGRCRRIHWATVAPLTNCCYGQSFEQLKRRYACAIEPKAELVNLLWKHNTFEKCWLPSVSWSFPFRSKSNLESTKATNWIRNR